MLVDPEIVGDQHLASAADGGHPFAVGIIDPSKGYVHVLDDESLGRVMRTLDTITDFVNSLSKKEAFIQSGHRFVAYGEEDLLAFYLKTTNAAGDHDFTIRGEGRFLLQEGHWSDFLHRPEVRRKLDADKVSYLWDRIIEDVSHHALTGTLLYTSGEAISDHEQTLRMLAREPRVRRRMLAKALLEKVSELIPPDEYTFRIVEPSFPGDPYYVFVVGSPPDVSADSLQWKEYREYRRDVLEAYSKVAMLYFKDAKCVIGVATESGLGHGRSHDLLKIERTNWDDELEKEARKIQGRTGWLTNVRVFRGVEDEYPQTPIGPRVVRLTKFGRNDPCPCGSGRKFKRCHGRNA